MRVAGPGNNFNVNGNNNHNLDNNNGAFGMVSMSGLHANKSTSNLFEQICSHTNLKSAFKKARKHKTLKPYVIEFEKELEQNLLQLRTELLLHCYRPKKLKTFILREPKTRKISKSDFRDRVIHHAICNVIEPLFDKAFIYDSYANRRGKGASKAIERFDFFIRKISRNNSRKVFVLKADIKHYFDNVDHNILLSILSRKIADIRVIWLISMILANHKTKHERRGMPLGNLTSQFFANVYLNDLDYYVKNKLLVKYYIRYVDDFMILHSDSKILKGYKESINIFLQQFLDIELHPEKTRIIRLGQRLDFLGFRVFSCYKLLKRSNLRKMKARYSRMKKQYASGEIDYDTIYNFFEGWFAYAKMEALIKSEEN